MVKMSATKIEYLQLITLKTITQLTPGIVINI